MLLSFSYIYFRRALFNPFNVMIYLFSCWLFREGFDEYFYPFVEQYTSLYQNLNTGCCMDNPFIFSQLIINFFGSDRGWDGWMASLMRWTWVWVGSRSWWWTGKPGVLQSMGLQRVRHNWVSELNWITDYPWAGKSYCMVHTRLYFMVFLGFPGGSDGKESACNAGDLGSIPGSGRSPGEGMATHSRILAWRIP